MTSGCTASGDDKFGAVTGCHELDKQMTAGALTCGDTGACHTSHTQSNHGPDHDYDACERLHPDRRHRRVRGRLHQLRRRLPRLGRDRQRDRHVPHRTHGRRLLRPTDACHSDADFSTLAAGTTANCSRCHGGTAAVGDDNTPLFEASSAGHYGETTHTVSTGLGTVTAGGTQTPACSVCHSYGLRDAHGAVGRRLQLDDQGRLRHVPGVPRLQRRGSDASSPTPTRTNSCAACHTTGVVTASHTVHSGTNWHSNTAPTVLSTSVACGNTGIGCHNSLDLHAIHKNATRRLHAHRLPRAEQGHEQHAAAPKICGEATGCHLSTLYIPTQHNGLGAAWPTAPMPTTTPPARPR